MRISNYLISALLGLLPAEKTLCEDKIADNSFLIEEGYNQEEGVVQHISFFDWNPDNETWDYTFTQEWPIASQDHQFSYTIPISRVSASSTETGVGDLLLNYRYQAVLKTDVAFAPRFSLILPTGDVDEGLGNDAIGYQINLPLSVELSESVSMHWNLGATFTPENKAQTGGRANTTSFNYGASFIYFLTPTANLMVEMLGASEEETLSEDATSHDTSFFISPGARFAINLESGLQIVPGVAVPLGLGDSEGEYRVIGYLSFEHPF
jgi:hypothetical protein